MFLVLKKLNKVSFLKLLISAMVLDAIVVFLLFLQISLALSLFALLASHGVLSSQISLALSLPALLASHDLLLFCSLKNFSTFPSLLSLSAKLIFEERNLRRRATKMLFQAFYFTYNNIIPYFDKNVKRWIGFSVIHFIEVRNNIIQCNVHRSILK